MGDTRRVVDGERRATARPLRPAVPPDGDARPVPRPRRERDPIPPKPPAGPARDPDATAGEPSTDPGAKPQPEPDAKPGRTPAAGADTDTKADAGAPSGEKPEAKAGAADDAQPAGGRRRRVPFAHAVRTRPRQLAVGAASATRAWSRRPAGRTTLPALFLLALVGAATTAGAVIVPAAVGRPASVDEALPEPTVARTAAPAATPLFPDPSGLSGTAAPTGTPLPGGVTVAPPTGRPADALADWARRVSAVTAIPVVALQAYAYAELVLAQTNRACQLSWTTLAAIGHVESGHGSANGATLGPDGRALPEIKGQPLDGQGGRSRILDTDQGQLDGDRVYDRALGPMQFIPTTWQEIGADADNDGVKNPHDIDDAALAAGQYLCKGGRNMTIPGDWWGAILSYNDVRRYAQAVFDKADEYGRLSRNVR
ncbi:membrane-bound lytic murein transglycosylase B [Micromonospora sp. HB375]|uniref:lytic transglycosylase domain-containing protein n=1 Tax=unclassified Micromonospora TaxID=2617518 RepID=UPI001FD833BC|nr:MULTISPECIES: lytic transglycosylase domain-containing protein [unclassified Micromonospora]MBP1785824.1 membrane-bound lytic murein transglycosylase B [Micromonospora sp. HB375]MDH6470136.1 membrane-bound lytic murein transglycosylase B [Micromonospora sp. H404/HB375]